MSSSPNKTRRNLGFLIERTVPQVVYVSLFVLFYFVLSDRFLGFGTTSHSSLRRTA